MDSELLILVFGIGVVAGYLLKPELDKRWGRYEIKYNPRLVDVKP